MKRMVVLTFAVLFTAVLFFAGCENDDSENEISTPECSDGARDPQTGLCTLFPPDTSGPYEVGTFTITYWDNNRDALMYRNCPEYEATGRCPRPVVTQIWYPSTDEAKGQLGMELSDFLPISEEEMNQLIDELAVGLGGDPEDYNFEKVHSQLLAVEGAAVREGKFPLIYFSHGAGGVRFQSVFLTEILAKHGYIVISPDHEGDATVLIVDGDVAHWPVNPNDPDDFLTVQDWMLSSATNRMKDVTFLLDRMEEENANPESKLFGRIDMEHVGLTGHSFGALTSVTMQYIDERIDATVPMAMFGLSSWFGNTPTFFMIAGEDDTIQEEMNKVIRWQYETFAPPKFSLELLDAGHFTYSNMCDLIPDFGDGCGVGERHERPGEYFPYPDAKLTFDTINYYTIAFFGYFIKEQPEYMEYLKQEPYQDQMRYEFKYQTDIYDFPFEVTRTFDYPVTDPPEDD
jgi:dienelactone hydrolase